MSSKLILGLLLLGAAVLLAILWALRVDTFNGTVVYLVAAIAAFIGAREVVDATTHNTTPN